MLRSAGRRDTLPLPGLRSLNEESLHNHSRNAAACRSTPAGKSPSKQDGLLDSFSALFGRSADRPLCRAVERLRPKRDEKISPSLMLQTPSSASGEETGSGPLSALRWRCVPATMLFAAAGSSQHSRAGWASGHPRRRLQIPK